MRKPNQLLKKKYISSLVIAAFMILTMLTAYNIRMGKEDMEAEKTEVRETIGDNDTVIGSGKAGVDSEDENTTNQNVTEDDVSDSNTIENEITEDNSAEANVVENEIMEDNSEEVDSEGNEIMEDNSTDYNRTENRNTEDDLADNSRLESNDMDDTTTDSSVTENGPADDNTQKSGTTEAYSYNGTEKLPWPLVGNIILPYSMDTTIYYTTLDQYACNDGILISAKKGSPVTAVADGRIVNIYQSDKYGTTITLLIGQSYEVSYSQVENLQYEVGDEVKSGDMIASVAEPTRFFTLEGSHLFFKMTFEGEPVNPTDYLEV